MRLLILTQKVDKNDDILGFFHAWVREFSKHCEGITVICLGKGEYDLPKNIKVLSLGKENGASRMRYIGRFYRYIWRERKNYDTVFVHMNQEYVLLGGLFWRIFGKKVSMWRNDKHGDIFTRIAIRFSNIVFCTSPFSYTAKFKKTKIMPVGVDTELFRKDPSVSRIKNSILCVGRISPVKNVDVLIEALLLLDKESYNFIATIVGDALPKDVEYLESVKTKAEPLLNSKKIQFLGSMPNDKTPEIYRRHEIYVNLTESESFDKTILEAMASGCLVLASNVSLKDTLGTELLFQERNAEDLAEKLKTTFSLSEEKKAEYGKNFREYAVEHNLRYLAEQLFEVLQK